MHTLNSLFEKIQSIETMLKDQQSKPLSFEEACNYLDVSSSYLYKLTSKNIIPFYKPNGKKIYFAKQDLDNYLFQNRQKSLSEIEEIATEYVGKQKGGKKK